MPTRPPTLEAMRAPAMERVRNARRAMQRAVYASSRWRWIRSIILAREPLCRACQRRPAIDIDHIIDIVDGGPIYDDGNLQPLCKRCHSKKTGSN